jgi:predicted nicotinamide N-methyase
MAVAMADDMAKVLAQARKAKLPMTVRQVLDAGDDNNMAILVSFADGTQAACLIPVDMFSVDNIRISAAAMAVVWEILRPPPMYRKGQSDDVIDLEDLDG